MKARRWSVVSRIVVILLALFTLATPVFAATVAGSGTGTTTVDEYSLDYSWEITYQKASESDSNTSDYKNGSGNVTYSDGAFTLKAKSSYYNAGGFLGWGKKIVYNYTTILTLTNNGDYGCKITYNTSGALGTVTGATKDLAKGESTSFTVATTTGPTVTTAQDLSGTVTITAIEVYDKVNVGFASFPNGSYTYKIGDTTTSVEPGAATVTQELAANSTVTLTAGDAVEGYAFYGWMSSGSLLSTESPYEYSVNVAGDVYPVFISSEAKTAGEPFKVGDNSYMFWHLAFEAAKLSGDPVRVNQNMTLPTSLLDNGLLSGHKYSDFISVSNGTVNYIVPSGSRLLIPYGSEDTVGSFSGTPSNYLSQADAWDLYKEGGTAARNFVYRCLTVPAGAKIDCYGSINVNGQRQETGQPYIGVSVGGYGKLLLNGAGTEQLTVHGGGFLYAYGYITGSGKVNVLSGGEVHELMQVCDWPGGRNAYNWRGNADKNTLFLLSQYYIQNIETTLQVNSGAMAYAEVTIHGSNQTIPKSAPYIGSSTGLFRLGSNSYIVRNYDTSEDRVEYVLYGTASLGEISVSFDFIGTINLTSSSFVMPINGNMTLRVADGATMTFDQRAAFLPGSQLIIDEGGTVNLGGQVHIVDVKDFTKSYFFDRSGLVSSTHSPQFNALPYVATKNSISPRTNKLVLSAEKDSNGKTLKQYYLEAKTISTSALVQVDGTLNVSGQLLTTNKTSSPSANKAITGSGVINYTSTPAVTNLKGGEGETINTMTSTYGLANIAGVGNLKPLASGTYYGQESGQWYSYVVKADTAENLTAFTNITEAAAAEGNTVTRYNSETKTQETVSNVLGVVSTYLDSAQKTQSVFSFDMEAGSGPVITGGGENLVVTPLLNAEEGTVSYALSGVSADVTLGVTTEGTPTTIKTVAPNADNAEISSVELLLPANADVSAYFSDIGCTIQATSADIGKTLYIPLEAAAAIGPEKGTYALAYTTVADAVAAADGTNSYVTVLKDRTMTDPIVVATAQNITLDLGGKKLDGGTQTQWEPLTNNGTLRLINGSITYAGKGTSSKTLATVRNSGTIEYIEGMKLEESAAVDTSTYALANNAGATISEIRSGEFRTRSQNQGYVINNYGTIGTVGTNGNTVTIYGRRGIVNNQNSKVTTIGGEGSTVSITAGQRCIELISGATVGTIGEKNSTVNFFTGEFQMHKSGIYAAGTIGTVGGEGSILNFSMTPLASHYMESYAINVGSTGKITTIGAAGSVITINGVSAQTGKHDTYMNHMYGIINSGNITNIGSVASADYPASKLTINISHSGKYGNVFGISNSKTITNLGADGATITITSTYTGTDTARHAYGISNSGTITTFGAGSKNVEVISNQHGVYNTGTISAINNVTAVSTDTTGSYYTLYNTKTLKVNGGNFHHANGAANAVKNTSSLTYKTDYGLSEDTKDITLLDGTTTYPCYYVKHVNHTEKIVTGTPASCTEDGLSDGKVCSVCGEVLAEQQPIPAGHTYGELITKQDKIHTQTELKASVAAHYQCSVCEKYFTEEKAETTLENLTGEMPEHTYDGWIDTDPENHWQECSVCKLKSSEAAHSDSGDEDTNCDTCGRELHTHDYSNRGDVVTPGNCQTETTYQAKCSCGKISGIITGEKDTSKHAGELTWTQTAEKHTQSYSCCDAVTVAEENHEWSNGNCSECAYVCEHKDDDLDHICDYGCGVYQGVHADAAEDGDHVCDYGCKAVLEECSDVTTDSDHACDICGKQNVTKHSYTSKVTDPTCVDKGYTTYTCNCGDTYTADEVEANGHQYTESVTKAPSCTEPGEKTFTCSACGDSYTEEIEETGHIEGAAVVENEEAATCKAAGSYDNVIYCTVCKAELSRETIVVEKLAHTAGSAVEENRKESTCTVAGSYDSVVKCSVCGEEMSRNTVALKLAAHTEGTVVVENEKAATCTAEGSYDNVVYCTFCNAELSRQTVTTDEMGHTEVVDAAKTPTCTETGLTEGKHCSVCGEVLVKQETVDALGHDYESVVTAPTFDAQGYTTHTCSKCGDSYVDNYLAALIAVAQVGEQKYESLTEAVAEAAEGATVTLLTDATGAGMMINKNITIDFGGHTYTLNKTVGSAGTETLGFQILKDNNVTLKNGTLTSTAVTSGKEVKVLIQNYANLTLTDMDLEGTNENILYGLSSNSGKITLNGDTDITVHEKAVAFDVYDYSAAGYAVPSMKVNTTGKINGKIEVSETASLAISGGTFTTKIEEKWCAEGFIPTANTDGTYGVKVGAYVAETDGKKYETLAEAVAAAENGSTVNLLTDASGAGVVVNKDITIDFDGHTYTLNRAVGSAGTETLGFQILKENNVTLKNGILTSTNAVSGKEVKVLIQNYSDLTLTDMDLIGTNTNIQYALSNNSGNIVLNGNTDITVHENAVAFDVYDYSIAGYAVPSMKVNTTGKITGNIEVSETATLAISGGTFTAKIEEKWCAEGFIPTANTDGTYGVKAGVYVAQNGETKYETLADAIAAEGENVIVLQDITIHGPIPATDKIIDFNGHTISGTLLGTLKLSGGTLITAEGKKMAGPDADYYQTTDAMFTMDAALNINVLSGTMTLAPDEWWTLPGQKLEISEGASFVIPAGKTLQVRSEVIVNGEVTIDGTVNLHDANATVTTATKGLNIITTAGDKVWYTEGKYVVHTHTPGAEATCTEDQTCTVCGDVLKKAAGHTLTQVEAKAPTCTEIGWEAYEKCSVCDYTTYVEIAAKGHSYESEVTAPTCTAEGYTTYTCSVCNDSYVADKVDALGHTDAEAVKENEKAPTCTVDGSYESVVYCSVCDAELSRNTVTVPASGHTAGEAVTENEKAATCTADGSYDTVVYCTVCDAELSRVTTTVGQLGHSYDDGVETKAPTCTEEGVKTFTCGTCGDTYTEAIKAAGHKESSSVTAPTCTEKGYTTVTCSVCGNSYTTSEVPAKGHAWVEADCDTPKTCTVCGETEGEPTGEHTYKNGVCTDCGAQAPVTEINVNVEIVGAANKAQVTAPENGWQEGTNTFYVTNDLACVVVVSYNNGETYECLPATADGARYKFTADNVTEDTLIKVALKGDATEDGKVNNMDVTRMKQLANGVGKAATALQQKSCDLVGNNDGIKNNDVTRIKQLANGVGAVMSW